MAAVRLKKGTAQWFRLVNSARIFINLRWYDSTYWYCYIWLISYPSFASVYELYSKYDIIKNAQKFNLSKSLRGSPASSTTISLEAIS